MPAPLYTHRKEYSNYKNTDEELVLLFVETQRGQYFDVLYQRYERKVYWQCFSFVKDHVMAQDLTQDIFLKLIYKLNSFKEFSKFSTWLFALSRNHCVDHLHSVKRKGEEWLDTDMEISGGENSDNAFEMEDVAILPLQKAVDRLTPDEKGLLYMKYIDETSIRDIAYLLQTSESAIKMRLSRSKEKLRVNYRKQQNSWM